MTVLSVLAKTLEHLPSRKNRAVDPVVPRLGQGMQAQGFGLGAVDRRVVPGDDGFGDGCVATV
ncbi:MAG: hypothetical protein AAF565_03240 [Pseudomonadota bacterium]